MSDSALDGPIYEGVYGPYRIDRNDEREVLGYRLALSAVGLGQLGLLVQLASQGATALWPWVLVMATGLGLALRWIHIYLKPLHQALQLFWLLGCLGWLALAWQAGPNQYPKRATGSSRVMPIASGRRKQKNSLKPMPARAAKKGPIASTHSRCSATA